MRLASIYAPKSQSEAILKRLQEMAVMDIETAAGDEDTAFLPEGYQYDSTEDAVRAYDKNCALAESALKILNERVPEKKALLSFLEASPEVESENFYLNEQAQKEVLSIVEKILETDREIAEQKAERIRLNTLAEQLAVWKDFDLSLQFSGTKSTSAFVGTVVGSYTLEGLLERMAQINSEITAYCEIIHSGKDLTYVFVCCPKEQYSKTETVLRELGFARPAQYSVGTVREELDELERKIAVCFESITESLEKIKGLAEKRRQVEIFADYSRVRAEAVKTAGDIAETKNTVLIRGYIAQKDEEFLKKNLQEEFTVVIETVEADGQLAPVRLKNNTFASPAESLVEMYSLPSASDIDPTPLTGFFYYLFFGMMFSDAGYGLLMIIATSFALLKFKLSSGMKKSCKLFLYCGISTFLWGLVYGSFFGDSIAVLSQAFFGKRIALPALIDPMNGDAVTMLILSIALGLVQVIAALCAKFVTELKNGNKAAAFFDAGLWITTLLGIVIMVLGFVAFAPLKTVGMVVAIASVVGLILTQGRDKKNPIMRIFSGIASLYDITGFVSDLLSFSRLMALGLTTSAMSAVFNMLSAMGGRTIGGFVMLIIIFPLGHAINFGLNVLGAYVHTLRLQYVELFSRFYEGGGRKFKAFSFKTKYTNVTKNVKEEN